MNRNILTFLLLLAASLPASAISKMIPQELFCESLKNPVGIDARNPEFGWTLASPLRNQLQTGYELLVSDNIRDIRNAKGNVWQTGKVTSAASLHIPYSGKELASLTRYFWRVRTYDNNNEASGWSDIAFFETAMLNTADWTSNWIGDDRKNPADADRYKADPMPLFRKSFIVGKQIQDARLYISGLGYYEAYLNGHKVSDHVLDPGFTTYRKQVLYVVHDITHFLKNGNNTAGVMLGNGWWNPLPFKFFGRWDLRDFQQTGRPCFKAEIHIRYTDGSTEKIVTDESWQTATGPVIANNVYLGEQYDARLEQDEWTRPSFNPASWKHSTMVNGPAGKLCAQMAPPVRITKIIKAREIYHRGGDTFIVNMGQNFAGVARITVKGPAGTTIRLRYGEGLYQNGSLNVMTTAATQIKQGGISGGAGAPATAWQEDDYILKGKGIEIWSPRFTFHGFQYIEITGWPGIPALENIEGLRMNTDLEQAGNFSCSNELFNKLHEVIQWTFLSNVFSIQSDCPGREKMGYGGDMVATGNSFIYNYNMLHFYEKTVTDFANEQRPLGGITEIAPFTSIDDRGFGDLSGPLGWQLAFSFLQKQLYDFYGDKRIIQNNYPAFKRQLAFLQSKSIDNTFYWDISDHEALDPKPEALSAAVFYYHHLLLGVEFAGILGLAEDSVMYSKLAADVKEENVSKFLVPTTGRFDNATQSAQVFSLWYGLTPEKQHSLNVLNDEFVRHQWHLSTGIFSTKMVFDVLRENDLNESAYKLVNQKDYPGWGFMLQNGATTLWETWAFPEEGPSRNHPMFGSVDEWFYRSLAGINPLKPGFKEIQIKPQPAGDLTWAKGNYQSGYGSIKSDWKLTGKNFLLSVSVPANTRAVIYCLSRENAPVLENGKAVVVSRYEHGYAVIETGSGNYSFSSSR